MLFYAYQILKLSSSLCCLIFFFSNTFVFIFAFKIIYKNVLRHVKNMVQTFFYQVGNNITSCIVFTLQTA